MGPEWDDPGVERGRDREMGRDVGSTDQVSA